MKPTQVVVSVGLNVGDREPEGQYQRTLAVLECIGGVLVHQLTVGEWAGVVERTVQARLVVNPETLDARLVAAALLLRQDCIAVCDEFTDVGMWDLVHADGRVTAGGTTDEFPVLV